MRPPRPSKGFQGWGDRLGGAAWGRRGAAQQEQRLGSKPGSATKQACDWRSCGFSRPRIPLIENPHLGFCSLLRALHGTQNSLNSQGQRGCSLEESCLGHSVISKMPHGTRWHMLRPNGWIRHPRPGLLREQALWLKKPRKASGKSWALFSGTENASQERKPWKPAAEWLLDEAHAASGECSSSWERHRTGKTCQPSPPQRKGSPKKPEKPEHFRRPAPGPLLASAPGERRNMPTLPLPQLRMAFKGPGQTAVHGERETRGDEGRSWASSHHPDSSSFLLVPLVIPGRQGAAGPASPAPPRALLPGSEQQVSCSAQVRPHLSALNWLHPTRQLPTGICTWNLIFHRQGSR